MEIGTEISQKIRSAIKAKLIEQGAYVDDELPDYIMVMVANKKSQKQMTDDLSLFLGTNTEKFTSWLHGLLKKLQSINTDDGSKQKPKDRHKEHKGDKKKHKTSQGEKEKGAKSGEGSKVRKSSTGEREKTEKKKNEEKVELSSSKSKPLQQAHVEDVPEIKISEDTDEFNEENKEAELKEQKKSSSTGKPQPVKVAKSDKSSDVKKSGTKISTKDSSSTTSSNNKSKSSSSSTSHRSESKEVRKKPSSFVANIKRKYVEIEDEEEYDPANPAVGSVASIVRGPTRKSSVPKALQANKSLLMKAVTEAEKSVTTSKKTDLPADIEEPSMRSDRKPVDLKHRLKTAAGLGLLSRSKRSELEGPKYKADIDQETSDAKKPRRSSEGFENIRYTIQNESVARSKSPPKKVSPKTKAPPVAPSRVAASAIREMGHTSKVIVKKEQVSDDETSEGSEVPSSEENSDNNSDEVEDENEDSGSEEEIEVTDRAAQTVINMREKNFTLVETKNKGILSEKESQTDVSELGIGESGSQKLSKEKLEEIDNSLLNMFIDDLLPFEFVENEAFRMFAKTLEPKYHFPKRKKLVTEIGMLYNTVKNLVKSEIAGNQSVSFTHDSWTNMEGDLHDTVTVHFVTNDWKLRSAVLKTAEIADREESEGIAEHLEETRVKWNLSEPILVTDDSKSEHKIVKMLGWKTLTCFGSCIHTVIRRALKDRDASHFVETGRKLVREVLGNAAATEMFEKKKKLLLAKEMQSKVLVLDDGQSWINLLDMMASLAELTPALHAALMDSELTGQGVDLRSMMYTFNQHSAVESLVKILNTFKTAVEILTNSEGPTLQKVVPIFIKLDKVLEGETDDNVMVKHMKSDIKHEIKHFLDSCRETCLLACLLHPQTKQMAFISQREKEEIKAVLFNEVKSKCEKEFKESDDENSKFRKGKKGMQRQTKSMSEAAEISDVRRVVVNKGEDNGHVLSEGEQEVDKGKQHTDEDYSFEKEKTMNKDEQNDVDDDNDDDDDLENMDDGDGIKIKIVVDRDADNVAGPSGEARSGDGPKVAKEKVSLRNVKTNPQGFESGNLTNLCITVENDWLDDVICVSDDKRSPEETAKIELNLFMAEPASNKNPLAWWQEKQVLYPHIACVAKRVLAIPASSLKAEDIYRLERKNECRSLQIRAEHVDMMLFLKHNKALYETDNY